MGSIFIIERPKNQAQLRLLFVDRSVRGLGLGRWLVEESICYCQGRRIQSRLPLDCERSGSRYLALRICRI